MQYQSVGCGGGDGADRLADPLRCLMERMVMMVMTMGMPMVGHG
jgi:hypothetical protein